MMTLVLVFIILSLFNFIESFHITTFRYLKNHKNAHLLQYNNDKIISRNNLNKDDKNNKNKNIYMSGDKDFNNLRKLDDRIRQLTNRGNEYMSSFYDYEKSSFVIDPKLSLERPSVTSSCLMIDSYFENPIIYPGLCWEDVENKIPLKRTIDSLMNTKWSYDAFQTPVLIHTLSNILPTSELKINDKFLKAVNVLLENRSKLSLHDQQDSSTYLRFLNVKAFLALLNNDVFDTDIQMKNDIVFAIERANMIAFDGLCRQLAFYNASDSQNFDIIVLTYNLLTYILGTRINTKVKLNTKIVFGAFQVIFDEQNEDGTWDKGEPISSVSSGGLGVEGEDGGGRGGNVGTDAIRNAIKKEKKKSRDIGNQYVFSIDTLGHLLACTRDAHLTSLLDPYIHNIERSLTWVENNIISEVIEEQCSLDDDGLQESCISVVVSGWRSNHLQDTSGSDVDIDTKQDQGSYGDTTIRRWRRNGGPVAWSTAQVFYTLAQFRSVVKLYLTESILEEFGGSTIDRRRGRPSERAWDTLMDTDVKIAGSVKTLRNIIDERTLTPLLASELGGMTTLLGREKSAELKLREDRKLKESQKEIVRKIRSGALRAASSVSADEMMKQMNEENNEIDANDNNNNGDDNDNSVTEASTSTIYEPCYSMILFGPPGTAKSSICTAMAQKLGWNFLTIDTADFLADGLHQVASRMTHIFDRLKSLERTIILFDEVEEFCLDRENPSLSMESRMLTTAMLTQLNDLRRQQKSVFIIATNRLQAFDTAVIRPGRFDMLLFVGTPSLQAREKRLFDKLQATTMSPMEKTNAMRKIVSFMRSYWSHTPSATITAPDDEEAEGGLKFFNYAESERFIGAAVELANNMMLNEQTLLVQYNNQVITATIQGKSRGDYLSSEGISRI